MGGFPPRGLGLGLHVLIWVLWCLYFVSAEYSSFGSWNGW